MNLKETTSNKQLQEFKQDLIEGTNVILRFKEYGGLGKKTDDNVATPSTIDKVTRILNIVFNVIIALTMFLCFFALSSNMSANLIQQTKEVAVMRSIGFTKSRIRFLYFYEAMTLVIASSTTGVMIGMLVGFTFAAQQKLLLSMSNLPFYFPWVQFLLIIALSVICAIASTFGPTTQLTKNEIAAIFRMI